MALETLEIVALGPRVGGIAKPAGRPVTFVRGALPGERVACEISETRSSFRVASLVEVLDPCSDRIEPACPAFPECGGCSMQNLAYGSQLEWKRKWVQDATRRTGLGEAGLGTVIPSPSQTGYRNRVAFEILGGRPGLHRFRGDPFRVDDCPLLDQGGRDLLRTLAASDLSFCTRMCIRSSAGVDSRAVEFAGCASAPPSGLLPAGVSQAWSGTRGILEASCGWSFREELGGFGFPLPPGGFFQVNTTAAGRMAEMVTRMAAGAHKVLDLYGGVGVFALPLASAGAEVCSVEISSAASEAGRLAACGAGLGVEFVTSDCGRFLDRTRREGAAWDLVISDPPRAGMDAPSRAALLDLAPGRLILVSCDPQTLGRDLLAFAGSYDVLEAVSLDLFPQTDSTETVVLLERIDRRSVT